MFEFFERYVISLFSIFVCMDHSVLCRLLVEVMGYRSGSDQAGAHEPVYNVDVGKHYLYLPDDDGRHDVLQTHPGALQLLTK